MNNAPRPIAPKKIDCTFLDFDALELARQITLMDHALLVKIRPREFTDSNWIKGAKDLKSPNLIKFVNWGQKLTNWLITEIVSQKNDKLQYQTIEKIILLGQVF